MLMIYLIIMHTMSFKQARKSSWLSCIEVAITQLGRELSGEFHILKWGIILLTQFIEVVCQWGDKVISWHMQESVSFHFIYCLVNCIINRLLVIINVNFNRADNASVINFNFFNESNLLVFIKLDWLEFFCLKLIYQFSYMTGRSKWMIWLISILLWLI